MIIVKGKKCELFVNENNIITLVHTQTTKTVNIWHGDNAPLNVFDVESVLYTNNLETYKSEGSEVKELNRQINELRKEYDKLRCNYAQLLDEMTIIKKREGEK